MCVVLTDLEARERQAEAQSQEEVQITRTLEEEVSHFIEITLAKILRCNLPLEAAENFKFHYTAGISAVLENASRKTKAHPGAFILFFIK